MDVVIGFGSDGAWVVIVGPLGLGWLRVSAWSDLPLACFSGKADWCVVVVSVVWEPVWGWGECSGWVQDCGVLN